MPLEIEDVRKRAKVDVVEHEFDEIAVGEDFQMLEGLILLVDLVEELLLVLFLTHDF
jgi:hypothetical protein